MTGLFARQGGRHGRVLVLALALTLTAGACSPGDPAARADRFVESATAALAEGHYEAAVIELKNALQVKSDHAAARLLLGRIYLDTYRLPSAEKEFERALKSGAAPEEVWPLLLRTLVGQDKFPAALEAIDRLPAELAVVPEIRASHADALLGQGLRAEMHELLGPAESVTDPGLLARLARLAAVEGDQAEAQRLATRAAEMDGANAYVFHTLGLIEAEAGRWERAREALRAARAQDPFSLDAGNALAQTLIALGEVDAAEEVVEDLAGKLGEHPALVHLRAVIAMERRDFPAVKAHAERVLGVAPDFRPAMLIAGIANSALGNHQTAIAQLDPIASRPGAPAAVLRALAWSNLQMGRPAAALRALEGSEIASDDMASLRLAVTAALQSENPERAESLLQAAIDANPGDLGVATSLAALQLVSGRREQAQATLAEIPDDVAPGSAPEAARLAILQLRSGNFEKALSLANDLKVDADTEVTGFTLAGLAEAALGQADLAVVEFEQALERAPDNRTAALALASLHQREGRVEAADDVLSAALEHAPADPRLLATLATLRLVANDREGADAVLKAAVESSPDAVAPKLIYARFLLTGGRVEEALELAAAAAAAAPDQPDALETLAIAEQRLGRHEEAVATLRRLVSARPNDAQSHFLLARSLAETGARKDAIAELETILRLDSNRHDARIVLARLNLVEGFRDAAFAHLDRLAAAVPGSPEVADLQGVRAMAENAPEEAVAHYIRAYAADPTDRRAVALARAQLATGSGGARAAEKTLLGAIESGLDSGALRLELGRLYALQERREEAMEQYRVLLERAGDNFAIRNDYAWLLWETGEIEEARIHAERAYELAPDSPEVMDTLGVVLLAAGETGRAAELLEAAVQGRPENLEIRLHLAEALAAAGETERARALLEELAAAERFSERARARELLDELGGKG